MSRSGYSDDCEGLELYRGAVASAIRGKRGQAFLKEMLAALDALPEKRLIAGSLIDGSQVCAIGSVGLARGMNHMRWLDPEDPEQIAAAFNIAPALVREVEFENDDDWGVFTDHRRLESDTERERQRFERVRAWVLRQINEVQAIGL
jgi:hypothetical protein